MFNGQITIFNGQITLFNGEITMFNGEITLFNGEITMFNGEITIFYGNLTISMAIFNSFFYVYWRLSPNLHPSGRRGLRKRHVLSELLPLRPENHPSWYPLVI
jgi:amino acid permease